MSSESGGEMKIWQCKIGEIDAKKLPDGADQPMRMAVRQAYIEITGEEPKFIFSGWAAKLTPAERECVDRRED